MKYKTIVIDPPWNIQNISQTATSTYTPDQQSIKRRRRSKMSKDKPIPYDTMTDDEIMDFPIDDFAQENSCLFLWTTHSKLPIAFEILKKWNFKYRACITWHKIHGMVIHGFTYKSEFCLLARRGKQVWNFSSPTISSVIMETRTTHSTKPKKFYDMIQKSTPEPRIDIFARQRHFGFDAWGDQVETPANTMEVYM